MSDNKTYYYLKLKENFFDSEEIRLLESVENGYLYSNILLKMFLKSLKTEGRLMFRENIPYNPRMLATITGHNIDIVDKAIKIFAEFGLIQILDSGAIYIADIQSFIGESSSEADRKRRYRLKIDDEKNQLGHLSGHLSDEWAPELETELKQELEKKDFMSSNDSTADDFVSKKEEDFKSNPNFDTTPINPGNKKALDYAAKQILHFLRAVSGTEFRDVDTHLDKIKARLKSGVTLVDCMGVIKVKSEQWRADAKMAVFLRPATLFAKTNFEEYLAEFKTKLKNNGGHL